MIGTSKGWGPEIALDLLRRRSASPVDGAEDEVEAGIEEESRDSDAFDGVPESDPDCMVSSTQMGQLVEGGERICR